MRLCELPAANDLFEFEAAVGIRLLIVHADDLSAKKIVFFRSIGKFVRLAMVKKLCRSIEAMEAIRPDIVRPLLFMYLLPWMEDVPDSTKEMEIQLQRDYLWSKVRHLFLARARSQRRSSESDSITLTDLPDACLRRVVAFYLDKPKAISRLCHIVTQS